MCWISSNLFGFILYMADHKCEYILLRIFDVFFCVLFQQGFFYTYIHSHFLWSLLEDNSCTLNCCSVVHKILFHHPIFLICFFCVKASYFHKLSSAACEIMVLMFPHSETILLISGISCSFCRILRLHNHRELSLLSNIIF
jgi:hypothetical protein